MLDDSTSPAPDFKGAALHPGKPIELYVRPSPARRPGAEGSTLAVNRLQSYSKDKYGLILGTQSPLRPIDPMKVHSKYFFSHPIHNRARYLALEKLPSFQKELAAQGLSIAGAWMGVGIHESGWTTGLQAAIALGGKMPYELVDSNRPVAPIGWTDTLVRLVLGALAVLISLLFD